MTPNPPSSSDGSAIPPRHRPNLGSLAKDTTETDLWAFDDIDPDADEPAVPARKTIGPVIPGPRDPDKSKVNPQRESQLPQASGEESIRVNVNKVRNRPLQGPPPVANKAGNDFDDLDHWDDPENFGSSDKAVSEPVSAFVPEVTQNEKVAESQEEPAPTPALEPIAKAAPPEAAAPVNQPVSALFKLDLSKTEYIGIIALAAVLLIGGAAFFLSTISRLPGKSIFLEENHYPIAGKHLTVVSAENYWRTPTGTDAVRRGTQLIPVVKLKASGGPGAVRLFFRDAEGEEIGDTVTRTIKDGQEIEVAATAGFDDVGMHAAYRTGQSKPWTVDILEAPSENSAGKDFKKLFHMNISAARH
jgi:hypothetical protein